MLSKSIIIGFFLIFAITLPSINALECYLCSPSRGDSCDKPSKTECMGSCGKEIFRGAISRGCYQVGETDAVHDDGCFTGSNGEWFCTCNKHLCNASTRTFLSIGSTLFMGSLSYLLLR